MSSYLSLFLMALVGVTTVAATGNVVPKYNCWDKVDGVCSNGKEWVPKDCTAEWGAFPRLNNDANGLIEQHLEYSIYYLLVANHFKHYESYRPGFAKYFTKLSDENWNEAISLLIHTIERGGSMRENFTVKAQTIPEETQMGEVTALGAALDRERRTAHRTSALAHLANHGKQTATNHIVHDSEFADFLSERLSHNFVIRIKHLANYVNLLTELTRSDGDMKGYALFKFDSEYLK